MGFLRETSPLFDSPSRIDSMGVQEGRQPLF